ncbi:MAG: hypothetical protein ACJ76S_06290 [Solirubrobacteraceae bacterium]
MATATASPPVPQAPAPPTAHRAPPRLARGIELIGRYEDSGFKEPPYIVRRRDGQVIQLPHLLYVVAEQVDGRRDHGEIAARVTEAFGRGLGAEDVRFLIDEKLRPLGIVADPAGTRELPKVDPLLALKFRTAVVPERFVTAITSAFKPLFWPPVVLAVVVGMMGLDGWLFFVHGVSQSLRAALYQPLVLVLLFGGVVVATVLHEIGHATACRYGGAKPGVMGVGIYIVWPAFFTDVTDAYRLNKRGRLRTDLGGVYFNAVFALAAAGAYFATGFEPVLLLVLIQTFAILQQMLPLLRLDGYYIISDLTGVPDMFARVRPTLASLIPGRPRNPRVEELKPWVRVAVSGYVLTVVPLLLFSAVMMMIQAPRVFATAYDSLGLRYHDVSAAFGSGNTVAGLAGVIQMAVLVLPLAGIVVTSGRIGRRVSVAAWTWSAGEPLRRAAVLGPLLTAGGLAAFVWWPNGDYRPIQPQEHGTIQGGFAALRQIATGRPSLTPERQRELHGAPGERSHTRRSTKSKAASAIRRSRRSAPNQGTTPRQTATTPQDKSAPSGEEGPTQPAPEGQTTTSGAPPSPEDQTATSAAPAAAPPPVPPPTPPGASP